jgi:hypothetical protein
MSTDVDERMDDGNFDVLLQSVQDCSCLPEGIVTWLQFSILVKLTGWGYAKIDNKLVFSKTQLKDDLLQVI